MEAYKTEGGPAKKVRFRDRLRHFFHIRELTPEEKRLKAEEDAITDSEINMYALSGERAYEEWDAELAEEETRDRDKERHDSHPNEGDG